jgi:hypothetical protein
VSAWQGAVQLILCTDTMPAVYSIMRTSASNGVDRGLYVYKLIDFGISVLAQDSQQAAETLLQTGTQGLQLCKGTIHWMSPEQVSPEIAVDTRTDLWSLAAVLYRVLSGVAPFAPYEQDAFTIAYEIRNAVVRPMARSVPDGLSQIVQRGLQKDRQLRWQTASEMRTALEATVPADPTLPPPPGPPMPEEVRCCRVKIKRDSTVDDRAVWDKVEARVADSLPDFEVVGIDRVQNQPLWRAYSLFTYNMASKLKGDSNEQELFHWSSEATMEKILVTGFDARLASSGEYGDGAYFALHPAYTAALRSLREGKGFEIPTNRGYSTSMLWARVCLGQCKDFGARCASSRGDSAAAKVGMARGLMDEWPFDGGKTHQTGGHRRRPPPISAMAGHEAGMYDSVTGTEANLTWTGSPRLIERGHQFGRQYVTFDPWQAYPELVVHLRRRKGVEPKVWVRRK